MDISPRLLSIASLINISEDVVDIGCDHGLLDIYLTLYKKCKCTCYDVNLTILNRAIDNIKKYNLSDSINTFVGNGFDNLNIDSQSVIVLSGMGTSTILKILLNNKSNSIICQTNTDLYDLRFNVCSMGYYISDERLVFDNNRYYVTIRFSKGYKNYSYDDYLLGPILMNDKLFKDYVLHLYNKYNKGFLKSFEFKTDKYFEYNKIMECLKKYI